MYDYVNPYHKMKSAHSTAYNNNTRTHSMPGNGRTRTCLSFYSSRVNSTTILHGRTACQRKDMSEPRAVATGSSIQSMRVCQSRLHDQVATARGSDTMLIYQTQKSRRNPKRIWRGLIVRVGTRKESRKA